jgi:peptidoglycan/xylan/chitin deacetylase (PgdA/CDA1 family)
VGENASSFPEIMEALNKAGHQIGNHSYNHIKGWNSSTIEYVKNTVLAETLTSNVLFRPPYGRITRKQGNMLRARGYRIVMWSLLSCDYLPNLNREKSLESLIKNSKAGSVVVFHDSRKSRENVMWLLPKYMEAMREKGFSFETL